MTTAMLCIGPRYSRVDCDHASPLAPSHCRLWRIGASLQGPSRRMGQCSTRAGTRDAKERFPHHELTETRRETRRQTDSADVTALLSMTETTTSQRCHGSRRPIRILTLLMLIAFNETAACPQRDAVSAISIEARAWRHSAAEHTPRRISHRASLEQHPLSHTQHGDLLIAAPRIQRHHIWQHDQGTAGGADLHARQQSSAVTPGSSTLPAGYSMPQPFE